MNPSFLPVPSLDFESWGARKTWAFAGALVVVFLLLAWLVANPLEETADQATGAARAVGFIEGQCPHGWSFEQIAAPPEKKCIKGDIVVTLYPTVKAANYAVNTRANGAPPEIACRAIPDWPDDWCPE